MKPEHVPGPWDVQPNATWGGYRVTDASGHEICTVGRDPWSDEAQAANARVLAPAPDVVAALRQCQRALQVSERSQAEKLRRSSDAFRAANAALAKVDGR